MEGSRGEKQKKEVHCYLGELGSGSSPSGVSVSTAKDAGRMAHQPSGPVVPEFGAME